MACCSRENVRPDRERPRDVARVVPVLAAGIDEEQIARARCAGRSSGSGGRRRSGPSPRCCRRRGARSRGGGTCRGAAPRPRTRASPAARAPSRARGASRVIRAAARIVSSSSGALRRRISWRIAPGSTISVGAKTPRALRGRAPGRWRRASRSSKRAVVAEAVVAPAGGSAADRELLVELRDDERLVGAVALLRARRPPRAGRPRPRARGRAGGRRGSSCGPSRRGRATLSGSSNPVR